MVQDEGVGFPTCARVVAVVVPALKVRAKQPPRRAASFRLWTRIQGASGPLFSCLDANLIVQGDSAAGFHAGVDAT